MCDTMAALPSSTAEGRTLFAKNSDRLLDEPQAVELRPARQHPAGVAVDCTHVSVPQAPRTWATMLCRPWWMWGAEMGVNEHGVAIGNEAVFARTPPGERPGLLGMDLVRLGLERGASAHGALEVIIGLLETHGQGGNCAWPGPQHYDNSFLIADGARAYVLETFGRRWVVEAVADVRAISNLFTIGAGAVRTSLGLDDWLRAEGWAGSGPVEYAEAIGDPAKLVTGPRRCARASELLAAGRGSLDAPGMMRILRDHGPGAGPGWRPAPPRGQVCSHADDAEPRGQTVNSLVAELGGAAPLAWVTASAAPCLSVFKPLFLDTSLPCLGPALEERFEARCFWWRHDRLQRALLENGAVDLASLRLERDGLEARFGEEVAAVRDADVSERQRVVEMCWREALALEERWGALLRAAVH